MLTKSNTKRHAFNSPFWHKLFGTNPTNNGMQPKEALSYSLAGLGQNLICGLVGSFVSYYFTNGLLLAPITVGYIMLGVRIFDALNDPIMGSIVDRTRTKNGKCRPYLKWMPIPIAILTVLLFLPLNPSGTSASIGLIVIITLLYTVWSVAYTIVDVPYWGLSNGMTEDTHQRGTMLTVARLMCTLGAGVIAILIPLVSGAWISQFADSTGQIISGQEGNAALALQHNFWWLAIIVVGIAIPTFWVGYKNSKERFYDDSKALPLKENLKLIVKNKPLLIVIFSGFLGAARGLFLYGGIYFATYNLAAAGVTILGMKGTQLALIVTMAIVPGGLIASLLVPYFTRKVGKRNTFIWSHIICGALFLICYICGADGRWQENWVLIVTLIGLLIIGIPTGFSNIITYAMIADTVDWLELHEGVRAEGICFSIQTLLNKIGMAFGAAFSCFALGWAHINPMKADTFTVTGNPSGLQLFFDLCVLIPAISTILCALPLFFYKFQEKQQGHTVKILQARKGINEAGVFIGRDESNPLLLEDPLNERFKKLTAEGKFAVVKSVDTSKDNNDNE